MPTHDEVRDRDHGEALREDADRVASAHLDSLVPVRVRVARHALDPEWMWADPKTDDEGRLGWLRSPVCVDGTAFRVPGHWAYVTELSPPGPGHDNAPSRWLYPRNLLPVRTPSPIVGDWFPDR